MQIYAYMACLGLFKLLQIIFWPVPGPQILASAWSLVRKTPLNDWLLGCKARAFFALVSFWLNLFANEGISRRFCGCHCYARSPCAAWKWSTKVDEVCREKMRKESFWPNFCISGLLIIESVALFLSPECLTSTKGIARRQQESHSVSRLYNRYGSKSLLRWCINVHNCELVSVLLPAVRGGTSVWEIESVWTTDSWF